MSPQRNGHQAIDEAPPARLKSPPPHRAVVKNLGELGRDAITLAELQYELFKLDVAESGKRVMRWGLIMGVALVLAVACLPVLLFGLSLLVQRLTDWPQWVALLATSTAGIVIAVMCGYVSWRLLQSSLKQFRRSQTELQQNLRWLKNVLSGQAGHPGDSWLERRSSATTEHVTI